MQGITGMCVWVRCLLIRVTQRHRSHVGFYALIVWVCMCVSAVYECVSVLAGLSLCLFKRNKCNLRKAVVWNPVMECGREKDRNPSKDG